jgi:hypothetical protein
VVSGVAYAASRFIGEDGRITTGGRSTPLPPRA